VSADVGGFEDLDDHGSWRQSISAGGGSFAPGVSVGWFALGPREAYVPSYRVSRNYVNKVNVSNTTVNTTVVNNYYSTTVVNNNVSVTGVESVNQHGWPWRPRLRKRSRRRSRSQEMS
jgi:hypothetical protein